MDIKVKIYALELVVAIANPFADALRCADNRKEPIPYTLTEEGQRLQREKLKLRSPEPREQKEEETPTSENLPQYTLEQVRAKLASLAQKRKQKKRVKEHRASFGVKKLLHP